MLVIVGWISFWIDPTKHHMSRALCTLSTLFTMTGLIAYLSSFQPAVSYTKAIDVWTGICLTFAFTALVEFVLVSYSRPSSDGDSGGKLGRVIRSVNLDRLARVVYPVVFVLFVISYWCWLSIGKSYTLGNPGPVANDSNSMFTSG